MHTQTPVALARTLAQTVPHTYANSGNYTATINVSDNASNTVTTTRAISVAPAGPTPSTVTQTADPTPQPLPPVAGLPDPVAGFTANMAPVKPVVLIRAPGAKTFVPLTNPAQVNNGSIIDARKGRVRITIANGLGKLDTADFYEGVFKITQPKVKLGQRAFADLFLFGGKFKRCPSAPRHPKLALFSKKRQNQAASVRHLWGEGTGAFRTVGRFSSASVRGTTWLTDDKCNGTLTRVTAGKVGVRDFVTRKTIVLRKGSKYFARAKKGTR